MSPRRGGYDRMSSGTGRDDDSAAVRLFRPDSNSTPKSLFRRTMGLFDPDGPTWSLPRGTVVAYGPSETTTRRSEFGFGSSQV